MNHHKSRNVRGLCGGCDRPPRPGMQLCKACGEDQAKKNRDYRFANGGGKWRPGGPGRPPKDRREIMEPVCKPARGPMRAEHTPDEDGDLCRVCGQSIAPEPAATPRPAPRAIVAPAPQRAHRPSAETKAAFNPTPAPRPAPPQELQELPTIGPGRPPAARGRSVEAEDVATIPDPIAATIAALELELEREEIDVTLATLRRLRVRRASA